jgi:hypothetical protein|tara:strand:- start:268 stop:459 length:192 start_codon:yes stop_codon:yes gene_type:complete
MNDIPPVEKQRIQSINFVMEDLHGSLNDIYESLIDKDYSKVKTSVNVLSRRLKGVSESVTDEI